MSWTFPSQNNQSGNRNQNQNGTWNLKNQGGRGGGNWEFGTQNQGQNFGGIQNQGSIFSGGGGNMNQGQNFDNTSFGNNNTGRKNNFIQKQFKYHPHNLNPERLHELKGPTDTITDIVWFKQFVGCSSWDKCVYVWQIDVSANKFRSRPVYKDTLRSPLLSCFLMNGMIFTGDFTGNLDVINIQKKAKQNFGKHMENPKTKGSAITSIKQVNQNTVLTSSLNCRCKYWDLRNKKAVMVVNCPERVFCADVHQNMVAVACGWAKQHLLIYDSRKPNNPMKSIPLLKRPNVTEALDHPGRNITICPDYVAVGSVGGRLSIVGMTGKVETFQSKVCCEGKPLNVKPFRFPVNGLCVNNKNGYTGVVDASGHYQIFDFSQKKRAMFNKKRISCSLTKCKFDDSGNIFAFGVSYDFSRGQSSEMYNNKTHQRILLKKV